MEFLANAAAGKNEPTLPNLLIFHRIIKRFEEKLKGSPTDYLDSISFNGFPTAFFHMAGPLTLYPVTKSAAADELEKRIAITKELAESLRNNSTIDWQKRDSARAKMRMMIKKLLKKHKYPPEGMDDAVQTVMLQCELWTDNNDMSGRVEAYASRLGQYASATHE